MNRIIKLLILQLIVIGNLYGQPKIGYEFNVGFKHPFIEGRSTNDHIENCYSVTRRTARQFENRPIYGRVAIKYAIKQKLKIGFEGEVFFIKQEKFEDFQTPIFKDVHYFPIRFISEYQLLERPFGDLFVRSGIGFSFGKTTIIKDIYEEQGGMNYILEIDYGFKKKLQGLFLRMGYELQRSNVLFDVNTIFGNNRPNCPAYTFYLNRHYLNFSIGLKL